MGIKKSTILLTIASFFFSGCGLYELSPFGSCNQWEIYSDKEKKSKNFHMDVCSEKLGFSFNSFDMKSVEEIQDMVYPRLTKLIQKHSILNTCSIKKESVIHEIGAGGSPLSANIICKKEIEFDKKVGRFFMTSFPF